MDENRNIANTELKNAFDGGLISIPNQQPDNLVELPKQEELDASGGGNVVNNFNVNVNVKSASPASMALQKTNATKIVNNIVGNSTGASPDEIKKNSTENSVPDGKADLKVIENEQSPIKLIENTIRSGPDQPILDIRHIDYYSPDRPSDYGYSDAKIKSQNVDLKRSYDMLHFLTKSAISDHMGMVPSGSVIENEFSENLKEMNFNYYEKTNIAIDENQPKMHDTIDSISEEHNRKVIQHENEKDQALNVIVKNQTKKQNNDLEFSEIQNGNDISGNVLSGAKTLHTSGVRNFNNMSSRSTTISTFIDKMNSPPIWRTVLG